jgi:hypothetical protein
MHANMHLKMPKYAPKASKYAPKTSKNALKTKKYAKIKQKKHTQNIQKILVFGSPKCSYQFSKIKLIFN